MGEPFFSLDQRWVPRIVYQKLEDKEIGRRMVVIGMINLDNFTGHMKNCGLY